MVANNRLHPRVNTQLSAVLESEEYEALELVTDNISESGVMLSVNREEFLSILGNSDPQFAPNKPGTREAKLSLELPASGKSQATKLVSLCRAVHVRRISQNHYLVGLKFTDISADSSRRLHSYIENSLHIGK